ncbi:hypothetical protein [uncultured Helicobacter sp.]|nr:hypothetical protein [uncultured Helicobacter sp.]
MLVIARHEVTKQSKILKNGLPRMLRILAMTREEILRRKGILF